MPDASLSLAALRDQLRAMNGAAGPRPVLPFGLAALDGRLADRGLRLDGLHEVAGRGDGWGDDAAAILFVAGIAARTTGPVLWAVQASDLFAPGLFQAGLAPERVLYAEARDDPELLALLEEGVRHRGLGAVIGEARRVPMVATRRLQLAAEGGATPVLLLRRPGRAGEDALGVPSAALTRWRVGSAPSARVGWDGLGAMRWQVACVRQRGGDPFDMVLEVADDTNCLVVPARLADGPAVGSGIDPAAVPAVAYARTG